MNTGVEDFTVEFENEKDLLDEGVEEFEFTNGDGGVKVATGESKNENGDGGVEDSIGESKTETGGIGSEIKSISCIISFQI